MAPLEILTCGAGIAGSTLAFWLGRAGHRVTLIEKAPEMRNSGLGIDIRGPAVEVIRRMGLEQQIRSRHTGEVGLAFVDTHDRTLAFFGIDQDNLEGSPTSEIEILRSDLTRLISDAALENDNVSVRFGTTLEAVSQSKDKVTVTLNGKPEVFDMVVAADGLYSTSRKLVLGGDDGCIHSLGEYTAYFSMPSEDKDGKLWKWYNAPGSRILFTRPKNDKESAGYLTVIPKDESCMRRVTRQGVDEQKRELATLMQGAGWQTERLLAAMDASDDFYLQHIAQAKLPAWQNGRCAAVGDAAYCPSPLSGVGTSLAILGAYVLAAEIARAGGGDIVGALQAYEAKLRPYVEKKQSLPPGVPWIAAPRSAWGVALLNWIVGFVARSGIVKLLSRLGSGEKESFDISEYDLK